ncbi:MAG: DUF5615 family PIN-like protein [Armatimonadetes bacterium]|nr:DUF5615 family PIN-like protein [Armatimonadota bacterium]
MRLLLDAHFDPHVAKALRARGHDVISLLDLSPETYEAGDVEVLELAARSRRAVVTRNIRDFVLLHRLWMGRESRHWGVVLIHANTIREGDRGAEIRALVSLLKAHPRDGALQDELVWLSRA